MCHCQPEMVRTPCCGPMCCNNPDDCPHCHTRHIVLTILQERDAIREHLFVVEREMNATRIKAETEAHVLGLLDTFIAGTEDAAEKKAVGRAVSTLREVLATPGSR